MAWSAGFQEGQDEPGSPPDHAWPWLLWRQSKQIVVPGLVRRRPRCMGLSTSFGFGFGTLLGLISWVWLSSPVHYSQRQVAFAPLRVRKASSRNNFDDDRRSLTISAEHWLLPSNNDVRCRHGHGAAVTISRSAAVGAFHWLLRYLCQNLVAASRGVFRRHTRLA